MELDHKMYADDIRKYADEHKRWDLKKTPFEARNPYSLSVNVKNSVSIENMQELDIIFSDKTGTLTKNQMVFHSYAGANGEQKRLKEKVLATREINEYVEGQIDPVMLFQLALCNDVLNASKTAIPTYQGASPDEVAFVVAAQKFGLELRSRNVDSINYAFLYNGNEFLVTFHCYGVIPFNSDRKKMSILLRECGFEKDSHALEMLPFAHQKDGKWYLLPEEIAAPGEAFVLTKGADSFMYPICVKADQQT